MANVNKVVWAEGMLLRQQQFQQQERYFEHLIQQHCLAFSRQHWGLLQLEIDSAYLPLNRISISRASGIFPDGTLFNIEQDAKLMSILQVPEGVYNKLVYLAIPCTSSQIAKISTTHSQSYRYCTEAVDILDEHSTNSSSAQIEVAKLQIQVLLESDDLSQYIALPIARIKEISADRGICLDEEFIAPSLTCQTVPALSALVHELYTLLYHRMNLLGKRLSSSRVDSVSDLNEILLLQVVNRYVPLFEHLTKKSDLHPEQLYIYTVQLLGELTTFTSTDKVVETMPIYQHIDNQTVFQPIMAKLRNALHTVFEQAALRLPLTANELGIYWAVINETRLLDTADFILAVKAQIDPEQLQQHLPKQIKIAAIEQIHDLIASQVPGLKIERLPVAPPQMPYYAGFSYFTIKPEPNLWHKIKTSGGLAIYITGEYPGLEMSCWAIRRIE